MRRRIIAVTAAAGLLGLIGGSVAASAGTSITAPEFITTVGTTVQGKFLDVGKKAPASAT